jgi:hypothetical protein
MKPLRSALVVLLLVAALAAAGCGGIGSSRGTNSGSGDDDSFYRANNFDTALEAVRGKVGPSGDILEIRVEARRTNFTVRKGKTESATGYSARAADGSDLRDFDVDVVGSGSLDHQSIPASDVTAAALTRMEKEALKRDPGAKLGTPVLLARVRHGLAAPRVGDERPRPALPGQPRRRELPQPGGEGRHGR